MHYDIRNRLYQFSGCLNYCNNIFQVREIIPIKLKFILVTLKLKLMGFIFLIKRKGKKEYCYLLEKKEKRRHESNNEGPE